MKKQKYKLKKKPLIVIIVLLIGLFIYSTINIINWFKDNKEVDKQMNNIIKKTGVKEIEDNDNTEIIEQDNPEETSPYWTFIKIPLINVNFTELKMINEDTVGWINMNNTNINYPFVQTTDNSYYLSHAFDKTNNKAGWVFMDYRNNAVDFDKNTILYAHSRFNNTMFGSLKNVLKSSWYNNTENHVIRLSTEAENTMWQIISVYSIENTNDYLNNAFNNDDDFINFTNKLMARSIYNFNVSININDKLLTLSTCYKTNDRIVVHAKLIKRETKSN